MFCHSETYEVSSMNKIHTEWVRTVSRCVVPGWQDSSCTCWASRMCRCPWSAPASPGRWWRSAADWAGWARTSACPSTPCPATNRWGGLNGRPATPPVSYWAAADRAGLSAPPRRTRGRCPCDRQSCLRTNYRRRDELSLPVRLWRGRARGGSGRRSWTWLEPGLRTTCGRWVRPFSARRTGWSGKYQLFILCVVIYAK